VAEAVTTYCRCGHIAEDHDPDDGCGACAMAMVGPCRKFRPRHVAMSTETFMHLLDTAELSDLPAKERP